MADVDDDIVSLGPKQKASYPNMTPGPPGPDPEIRSILSTSYEKVPSGSWEGVPRALGMGLRNAVEGIASLPTMAADATGYPVRLGMRALGLDPGKSPSELSATVLNAVGLPQAQTEGEKARAEAIRGGAAMLNPMALGTLAPRLVAQLPAVVRPLVASNPATGPGAAAQVVAGGTGAATGDWVAGRDEVPEWLKPTARMLGGIGGAGVASGVTGALGTLRNAIKGVPSGISEALQRLQITPGTAGAVTDRPGVSAFEGNITRLPSAAGVLLPAHQQTINQFGDAVERTAAKLHPSADTPQAAGDVVQKALRNWRENVNPVEQEAAWRPLNQRLAGTAVDPAPYRAALEYAASPPNLASLPENQRAFASAQARKWLEALNADVPPGRMMSWEQAQALKTRIGDAMGTPEIVDSIGGAQLRRIYGGLAQGMENTANQHGQGNVFKEANQLTTDAHQFLEGTVSKAIRTTNERQELIGSDTAATALLADNTAMQQLRDRVPDAADALAAFQLRQAARARPSQQGAGDTTSTGTFLTNMRNHELRRPEGQAALYNDPGVAGDIFDLKRVAEQLRATERNINSANTGATVQAISLVPQMLEAYRHGGGMAAAAQLGANYAGPAIAGKFLTNPALIKLMAAQPGARTPIRPLPAGLLGAIPSITVTP